MTSQDVADYLHAHPEFFEEHADLLNTLTLPHPHRGRAISLTERQMLTLREKNKVLELRLSELLRHGEENEVILEKTLHWSRNLLLERNARRLPEALIASLTEIFSVPEIALRIWDAADEFGDLPAAQAVPVGLISFANSLKAPLVGGRTDANSLAFALLAEDVQSIAAIALRRGGLPEAFGLLVLGSPDPRRFHSDMGTSFLARLGELGSAALTRLLG